MRAPAVALRCFRRAFLAAVPCLLAVFNLAGCKLDNLYEWKPGDGGAGGAPPTGGAPSCDADCVRPPKGWSLPSLVGVGSFTAVPACPPGTLDTGFGLYSHLQAPPVICPVCQCAASDTTCAIPTQWHASSADCAGAEDAAATPFEAPPGWDGSCWPGGIPAGAQCGGEPCVQSLTVEPPTLTAAPCAPVSVGRPYAPPYTWSRRARECRPVDPGTCPEEPGSCFPPAGFSLCVLHRGDVDCPDPYLEKQLFYRDAEDTRACSECECAAPTGNACTVLASAFQDEACGTIAGALLVTSESGDGCVDIPPGLPLAGKTAEVVSTETGTCSPSGGEPSGRAAPAHPVTICCRQELVAR